MNAKFETSKQYQVRSIGDQNCVWTFEVTRRTEKSIWVSCDGEYQNKRLAVSIRDGQEIVKPFGTYSMSPTLRASNVVDSSIEITERAQQEAVACEAEYLSDRRAAAFFSKAGVR